MTLRFLEFERSDDGEGVTTFEAMASVRGERWPLLLNEASQLLSAVHGAFPEGPVPLDEGGEWDCALEARLEPDHPIDCRFEPASGLLFAQGDVDSPAFHTLTLTLCGREAWAQAFADAWLADEGGH